MTRSRKGLASLIRTPRIPSPTGSGPIACRSTGVMPVVMKSRSRPSGPTTPRAPYRASVSLTASSMIRCRTTSSDRSEARTSADSSSWSFRSLPALISVVPSTPSLAGSSPGRGRVSRQIRRGFRAAGDLKLREDAGHVVLDRLFGQVQLLADLPVRPPGGNEFENPLFLGREACQPFVLEQMLALSQPIEQTLGDGGIEQTLTTTDRLDRPDEVGALDLLQDVAR